MTSGFLSVDKKIHRFTIFFSSWEIQVTRQTSFSLIKCLRIGSCLACEYRVVDQIHVASNARSLQENSQSERVCYCSHIIKYDPY